MPCRFAAPLPALVAGVVLAIGATACGPAPAGPQASAAVVPMQVQVTTPARSGRPDVHQVGGTLHGRRATLVSARVMGTVTAVAVQPGDRVRAGQLLVSLDDAAAVAEVRAAGAGRVAARRGLDRARADANAAAAVAALARTSHQRIAALHARRSATPQELDDAAAALAAAEARETAAAAAIAEAEAGLDRATAGGDGAAAVAAWSRVMAPFDGVITERLVDPGNLVSPGSPLVRLEDTSSFEFEARLDDSRATHATPGAGVRVRIDADDTVVEHDGRITEVGRAASVDSRAVVVTIAIDGTEGLRPGMFGRALLPGAPRDGIAIPESAVVRRGQLTSVFVVEDNTARMRLVRLGAGDGHDVDVVAGLAEGDRVVLAPPAALRDGTRVSVGSPGASAVPTDAGRLS